MLFRGDGFCVLLNAGRTDVLTFDWRVGGRILVPEELKRMPDSINLPLYPCPAYPQVFRCS